MTKASIDPVQHLRVFVESNGTQRAAAEALGVTSMFVGDMLKRRRPIPKAILNKLGLKQVVVVNK